MRSFCILGGQGVFGNHMAKYLLDNDLADKVICVGRNPKKHDAYTIEVGNNDPRFQFYQIHILFEQDRLFEMFDREKPECIMNFAALAYATSWTKSHRYYETNVIALAKMTEEIRTRDYFKHWMQIGSSEIYGSAGDTPTKETDEPKPTSPYAVSKLSGDQHLDTYYSALGFPTNVIRPSNGYGPGQQLFRVIPRAVYCGLTGNKLPLHGGGKVEKSFIHATDMAEAIYLIAEKAERGVTYNAGPEKPISIRSIVETVAKVMDIPFENLCEITEGRSGEDARYWLDSSRIKDDLGWEPKITMEEGVEEMVEWGKKYFDFLKHEAQEYTLHA